MALVSVTSASILMASSSPDTWELRTHRTVGLVSARLVRERAGRVRYRVRRRGGGHLEQEHGAHRGTRSGAHAPHDARDVVDRDLGGHGADA